MIERVNRNVHAKALCFFSRAPSSPFQAIDVFSQHGHIFVSFVHRPSDKTFRAGQVVRAADSSDVKENLR